MVLTLYYHKFVTYGLFWLYIVNYLQSYKLSYTTDKLKHISIDISIKMMFQKVWFRLSYSYNNILCFMFGVHTLITYTVKFYKVDIINTLLKKTVVKIINTVYFQDRKLKPKLCK